MNATTTLAAPIAAGAIFACSWGYEQTNVDFYRVERVAGSFLVLQPIAADEASDGEMSLTGRVVPAEPHRPDGAPIRRKLKVMAIGEGRPFVQPESYSYAYPWDGRPMRVSHYA